MTFLGVLRIDGCRNVFRDYVLISLFVVLLNFFLLVFYSLKVVKEAVLTTVICSQARMAMHSTLR